MHKQLFTTLTILFLPAVVHAQLMDAKTQARLEAAAPKLSNEAADDALHGRVPGSKRLLYTSDLIEHASQDHGGNSAGFYLSAHNRSAFKDGKAGTDFEFPWKDPGGTEPNTVFAWKVMYLPPGTKVAVHYTTLNSFFAGANGNVFFGRNGEFQGYDWTFPTGTRFFEVLSFADRLRVFEVRTRTKTERGWRMNVYRPFPTRAEFMEHVEGAAQEAKVKTWTLHDKFLHRHKTAFNETARADELPGFATKAEADEALSRPFKVAFGRDWASESGAAPWTSTDTSIVPKGYNGTFVGNDNDACMKCHQDAATHVRFFDRNREWYGFVRGSKSEKILSFHPIEPSSISRNGGHRQPQLNKAMLAAGLIEWTGRTPSMARQPAKREEPAAVLYESDLTPPKLKAAKAAAAGGCSPGG